jgi:hypothetical protein
MKSSTGTTWWFSRNSAEGPLSPLGRGWGVRGMLYMLLLGEGDLQGLEARATGVTDPYPLPQTPTPNPIINGSTGILPVPKHWAEM